jgi:hypothetical protein
MRSIELLGARYYSSDYSRFLSTDPRAYDYTEWSPYNYVLANPIRLVDPDGKSLDCCPWQEFATGFADRAAQIAFVPYGVYKSVESAPETANGFYKMGERILTGKGEWYDYARLFDMSGTLGTIAEIQHVRELYDAGEYEALGAYAYDAIVAVVAAGAELPGLKGSKTTPKGQGSKNLPSTGSPQKFSADLNSQSPTHYPTRSKSQMKLLMNDIRENGIGESIKFVEHNGKKYIVDGHHRYFTAKKIGIKNVVVEQVQLPYLGYQTAADLAMEGRMPGYWNYLK